MKEIEEIQTIIDLYRSILISKKDFGDHVNHKKTFGNTKDRLKKRDEISQLGINWKEK